MGAAGVGLRHAEVAAPSDASSQALSCAVQLALEGLLGGAADEGDGGAEANVWPPALAHAACRSGAAADTPAGTIEGQPPTAAEGANAGNEPGEGKEEEEEGGRRRG